MNKQIHKQIHNPALEKPYLGGELVVVPKTGDLVRVIRGPLLDKEFRVAGVWGHSYNIDQQVYVIHDDALGWFYPWDVELL